MKDRKIGRVCDNINPSWPSDIGGAAKLILADQILRSHGWSNINPSLHSDLVGAAAWLAHPHQWPPHLHQRQPVQGPLQGGRPLLPHRDPRFRPRGLPLPLGQRREIRFLLGSSRCRQEIIPTVPNNIECDSKHLWANHRRHIPLFLNFSFKESLLNEIQIRRKLLSLISLRGQHTF